LLPFISNLGHERATHGAVFEQRAARNEKFISTRKIFLPYLWTSHSARRWSSPYAEIERAATRFCVTALGGKTKLPARDRRRRRA